MNSRDCIVITSGGGGRPFDALRDLWRYRELLGLLSWRTLKSRYRQTFLGMAWAVLQPLMMMVVFTVVFGRMARLPSDGHPYALFVFIALLPWQLFAQAANEAGNSLIGNASILTKVFFPRLILPIAALIPPLVDFGVSFLLLLMLLVYFGVVPTVALGWLPVYVAFTLLAALTIGLWVASLSIRYRDIRVVTPLLMQVWLFASPVAYASSLVPEKWRLLYFVNPMAGVVDGFRWMILGGTFPDHGSLLLSAVAVIFLFITGLALFRRAERTAADLI